ncbi:MAG TPA: SUMF1/EgtB/PvdO family nonheme iron enzyme [Spirochaetota bacterium]|nr:SUMF1/EgtB/PvdO family nonheme iron enzyme [Spirochaetota bacterium]HOL56664.1 SUMF1/EgtB/PvdO family nonheme iron enzyme [Spirochaetota bacterium]HPP05347.1 SUMF1/EgtB/PvdO family nonheme iron enzyme [Spirochaetota bacterium]
MKKIISLFIALLILFFINAQESKDGYFVFVQGGTFKMGDDNGANDEKPAHEVTLNSFWIGKYEVTQKEFFEVMGYNNSKFKGDDRPMENVSWYEAIEFCNKKSQKDGLKPVYKIDKTQKDPNNLNSGDTQKWIITIDKTANGYRLPTEAEWEFAARGGLKSKGYKYSGANEIEKVAWFGKTPKEGTNPVGKLQPNELGIYDMNGNIFEWCWDWYDVTYYSKSPKENPTGPEKGEAKVMRGGSWDRAANFMSVSTRNSINLWFSSRINGFRICKNEK